MKDNDKIKCVIILEEAEEKLIKQLRSVPYGKVVVFMQGGRPIRIEVIRESIAL